MKLCDRCRVSGCCSLNYLGEACKLARKRECPDVVFTNADRIRSMSDEELAGHIWNKFGCPEERNYITCGFMGSCKECWLDWLRKPAEED